LILYLTQAKILDSTHRLLYSFSMDRIADRLDAINKTLEIIADAMPKKENRTIRVLKTVVLVGAALGIINIIDTIVRWFTGG